MSVDVSTEIVIGAPCETVASYASDPDNAPQWYVNIKAVEWLTTRPLRVGSRIAFVAYFLGRRMAYTYEIAEFVPARLVMRTSQGPFPMETTYEFEPLNARSTRMRLRNRGEPDGFSRMFAPFLSLAMRRANRKDLALLKRLLESRKGD